MRAITVCVDFADLLAVTLAANIHHFTEYWVVTSLQDEATHHLCLECQQLGMPVQVLRTGRFYEGGAAFNKWAALEIGLTVMERRGWLCLLDADVLWPANIPSWQREIGCLYTPMRRMFTDLRLPIPSEAEWSKYPLHPQQREWAGYTQIFHADDPVLGKPPWHETNWRHAGGADSFFQRKWSADKKRRPPFEVMHLGESGQNWCGRVTPYLSGLTDPQAASRLARLQEMLADRRWSQRATGDPYLRERLPPPRVL